MKLPEEIERAIDALVDAEHGQRHEGYLDAEAWCEAAKVCNQAREALTAAILSRLREAETWHPISTVPLGVEVLVFGGITIMGGMPLGRRVAVIDDRRDLCREDNGELRRTSPTMWTHLPAPPALSEASPQGNQ